MLSKSEVDDIKKRNDIIEVVSRYVVLKKDGVNFIGCCPFHSEKTASFSVSPKKQIFKCFGCGKGGDVLHFLMEFGKGFKEALKELEDPKNTAGALPTDYRKTDYNKPAIEWKILQPPLPFVPPPLEHYRHGKPGAFWAYRNIDGNIIGFTCRFNFPGGKKEVLPYVYATNGQREEWRWKGFDRPRPLYNLQLLKLRPDAPVMLGEGEKTADAMNKYFSAYNCLTWIGGVEGVKHADFMPLYGRKILLWPDNDKEKKYTEGPRKGQVMDFHDQPGNKAMLLIYEILKTNCETIEWVNNPPLEPCGWDVADAVWDQSQAVDYLANNITFVPPRPVAAPVAEIRNKPETKAPDGFDIKGHAIEEYRAPVSNTPPPAEMPNDGNPRVDDGAVKDGGYFRFLGYQKEGNGILYHFYTYTAKTVVSLTPGSMSKPNLLQLASMQWWEMYFPGRRAGFELEPAQNWLIQKSTEAGVFNSKWIRGRGAWLDGKDVVVHAGDRLIVNGNETSFEKYNSKYIYEIGDEMGFKLVKPLTTKEAKGLVEMLDMISWEREINSYLVAGWCVIAPICGALLWRPHIWINGAAGTGKSWIFEQIIRRILGESALSVQSETSEAGLRQTLRHDALPVVFDEAEANDRKAAARIQDVLSLMRASSSSDGGLLLKGTAGGAAKSYQIRSCFAFASISVPIKQQSDRTRVTICGVKAVDKKRYPDQWKNLVKKYDATITDEYCAKFRARAIAMLPTILKNAQVFSNAAAAELGQQRAGDQVGALLAGAYSLRKNGLITFNEAVEFIKVRDWAEERSQTETRDEIKLINYLMNQITRIESSSGVQERSIGELVMTAAGLHSDILDDNQAQKRLNRIGVKVLGMQYVCIANDHDAINKFLENTPWSSNYNKILARLEGAAAVDPTRFASGVKVRAVKIPYRSIFTEGQLDLNETALPTGKGIITKDDFPEDDLPF